MKVVDLRSDTVTRPTPEMYAAMMTAPVGDDVLGDDPSVIQLERLSAEKFGKEAALFVPSGTMGNQIAVATHTQPGDAIIIEEEAHIIFYEVGAPAVFSSVLTWTLPSDRGVMDPEMIEKRITKRNLHTPGVSLICLENSHNRAGGTVIPIPTLAEYRRIANENSIPIHVDGARIFNASVALGVDVREISQYVDTVSFCLSKGLGAPVGSVLVGPKDFIDRARFWRKRMGGGMRQSGILAAAGIIGLSKMVDRLAEDHKRVQILATEIGQLPGFTTEPEFNPTNLCMVRTEKPAQQICEQLQELGVLCFPAAKNRVRLVTHFDVNDEGIHQAIDGFKQLSKASD